LRCTGCNASIRASPRSMSNTCIPSIASSTSLLGPANAQMQCSSLKIRFHRLLYHPKRVEALSEAPQK
jgi:hypothetical protein